MQNQIQCAREIIKFIGVNIHLQDVFYITAMISVIIVALQFRYTIAWNKKQLTIKILNDLKEHLKEHFDFLHKTFRYRDIKDPISVEVIHDAMGIFVEGDKNNNDNDIVNISGNKFMYHKNKNGLSGKDIRLYLTNFLNDIEAFSAGVNSKTFDEEMSKKLMKGIVVRAYRFFMPYIMHLREDHKNTNKNTYQEFLNLGKRWDK